MKKLLFIAYCLLLSSFDETNCFSQSYCGFSRYDNVVFSNVTVTSDVVYGSNTNISSQTEILKLDVYEPTGDTATIRPLLVLAHGGSFIVGDKLDMSYISIEMAKRGYVVASINYRLGIGFPIDSIRAMRAVWRATQDMKASVRFFRKDAATSNTYKIDSNMIFIGGASAGSIMAIHYAYLDQPAEIPSTIDTIALGGIEGNSGNPGYSSSAKAVVNICGAIADTSWMKPGDENMVSMQGNWDETVPYCSDIVYLSPPSTWPLMIIHGLGTMVQRANNIGMYNPVHTFYRGDHGSPGDTINIDTTIVLASDFLYKEMGCIPTNTVNYTNTPICVMNIGVNDIALNESTVTLYPNPTIGLFNLKISQFENLKIAELSVYTIYGDCIHSQILKSSNCQIDLSSHPSGIYFLKLNSDAGESFTAKIIFTE